MALPTDLDVWLANKIADLRTTEPGNTPGILLGAAVWGQTYIDRLATLCMPSLLAPANIEALRSMNARVMLITVKSDFTPLWRAVAPLERAGVPVQFDYIPKELLTGPLTSHKFQALGTMQNLTLQKAGWIGMGYHMLMPDHVYSERYFAALADMIANDDRIAQGAVAHGAISGNLLTAGAELDRYRSDGALCIPARTLGDIGFRHMHRQTQAVLQNGRASDDLPKSNIMVWRARNALHIAGPHGNPAWISPRLCRDAPVVAPTTLDAELPNLMPEGYAIPAPDSGMVCIELSDDAKTAARSRSPGRFSLGLLDPDELRRHLPPGFRAAHTGADRAAGKMEWTRPRSTATTPRCSMCWSRGRRPRCWASCST
jgi:hypothetical protein